ncbi:MAG: EAL domain-containing protein [Pseudorhodoplanes sp.]|uniref:EAL domain-containing protein n=1 Tax=Pseudorhodoplanes sp. TaxID=1934341 RepID=UPI003D10DF64
MSSKSRKLIAIAVGLVLAGAPIAGLNFWVDSLLVRQSANDVETFARRSIHLAEIRLDSAMMELERLAERGVDGCRPDQVEALRKASLSAAWVKQFSVVGAAGQPLCGDINLPGLVKVLAARPVRGSTTELEVIQLGDQPGRLVRLRRPVGPGGATSLSALLLPDVLVARLGLISRDLKGYGQLALVDGTMITETGTRPSDSEGLSAVSNNARVDDRLGLRVTTSHPQTEGEVSIGDLRELAITMTGILSLALVAIALILRQRRGDNPVAEIERGLRHKEFVPYYQPIVDITSGRLRGAEVLMRWKKSDGTVLPPAAFIPLAESSGMILAMTRSMMRQVVAEMGPAFSLRPKLKLGFNMTAEHFSNETIVRDLRTIFERSSIRYSQIFLEVTERQPLENLSRTRRVIATLQDLGVRIAIDDVGAGHGGLSYILKLGADIIKIDKMFVDALGSDNHSSTIIETLVDLAESMRMDIIAEGVETFEQVVALRERGIRTAQGFVFAPPLPGSSFLKLVEAIDPQRGPELALKPGPLRAITGRRQPSAA